MKHYKSVEIS